MRISRVFLVQLQGICELFCSPPTRERPQARNSLTGFFYPPSVAVSYSTWNFGARRDSPMNEMVILENRIEVRK